MIASLLSPDAGRRPSLEVVETALRRQLQALVPADPTRLFNVPNALTENRSGFEAQSDRAENGDSINCYLNAIVDELVAHDAAGERHGYVFPTGEEGWATNPLCLAYGVAGPVTVLASVGNHALERSRSLLLSSDLSGMAPSLMVGAAGIARCLSEVGELDYGADLCRTWCQHAMLKEVDNLFYGSAGLGMTSLHIWRKTGDDEFLDIAYRLGGMIVERAVWLNRGGACCWPLPDGTRAVGLGRGASGISLFLLYLYIATGDEAMVRTGRGGVSYDVSQGITMGNSVSYPPDDKEETDVVTPYLEAGDAGVGSAVLRYRALFADDTLDPVLDQILAGCSRRHAVLAGLLFGQAGIGRFLLDCASFRKDDLYIRQASELWEAMVCKTVRSGETGGIGFVGDVNGYLSSDLANGSAGILAFGQRLHDMLTKGTCSLSSWGVFDLDDLLTDRIRTGQG